MEIHKLLKLGDYEPTRDLEAATPFPVDLPIAAGEAVLDLPIMTPMENHAVIFPEPMVREKSFRLGSLLVYPAIFLAAFGFFYVLLNFGSIVAQVQGFFTKPQDQTILGDQLTAYYDWINGYYYAVGDKKLLDPNNDIDHDGLSNMDEFIMHTNPTVADSDSDGFSDGIEVINGMNPWGDGSMTSAQKKLAEGLNMIVINNRISAQVAENSNTGGQVLGANTFKYDLNKPGRLSIPRLNMSVPLIWSKDPSDFENDLTQGVIHYPGTALPGEQGTIYVSGHSSDYIWKKDPYHAIFAKLNYLQNGDDVFVDVYGQDGKIYNYRYQVVATNTYKPDDQTQFIDNSAFKLNLSTCWPIGTQKDRLVVSAIQKPL